MTEGNFPCSAIFLEGLPKMEVSPSLVGGRLVLDDVDVGELTGSRQKCRTSKGEDALIALGEDAKVVVVAVCNIPTSQYSNLPLIKVMSS